MSNFYASNACLSNFFWKSTSDRRVLRHESHFAMSGVVGLKMFIKKHLAALICVIVFIIIISSLCVTIAWSYRPLREVSNVESMYDAAERAEKLGINAELNPGSDGTMTAIYRTNWSAWKWEVITFSKDCLGDGRLDPLRTTVQLELFGIKIQF